MSVWEEAVPLESYSHSRVADRQRDSEDAVAVAVARPGCHDRIELDACSHFLLLVRRKTPINKKLWGQALPEVHQVHFLLHFLDLLLCCILSGRLPLGVGLGTDGLVGILLARRVFVNDS